MSIFSREKVTLIVGDSHAAALSVFGGKIINKAVAGHTTLQTLETLEKYVKKYKPHVVILSTGTNDAVFPQFGLTEEMSFFNLMRMKMILSNTYVMYLQSPQRKMNFLNGTYDLFKHFQYDLLETELKTNPLGDGIHLNDLGYFNVSLKLSMDKNTWLN